MEISLAQYIQQPERLNEQSLALLRKVVVEYPYFQPARLLFLLNLYRLHHTDFDRELRRAAVYLPSREALFYLIEGEHYAPEAMLAGEQEAEEVPSGTDRTGSLIDSFLSNLPEEKPQRVRRVDSSTDYMGYLMQNGLAPASSAAVPPMAHQDLIDDFIGQGDRRIVLSDQPDDQLQSPDLEAGMPDNDEDYFTETLAKIYIRQHRYTKALEIIQRLSLKYPKKNRYFADQIRFLEKLIINNKNKKQ